MRRALLFCAVATAALPGIAKAEVLTFTQTFVADFEFSLLGGTPINPGPTTPFLPFRAVGDLTFELSPLLNDPSRPTTVAFTNFTGLLTGVPPSPILPFTISPNVQFLGGELRDIVRDADGDVISANVVDLNALWELIGPGGLRLFGTAGLPFSGPITSLPFGGTTTLAGAAPFDVFLDDGSLNPPLVAIGRNRTLRVVPEPSSLALLGLGSLGVLGLARRKLAAQ